MKWNNKYANTLNWTKEISNKKQKEKIALTLAERVREGDVIGVGSGSTSYLTLLEISKRVKKEQLSITAIPTSNEIKVACGVLGIPTASLLEARPDWGFDGADEIDYNHSLIKGRGGALYLEKLVLKSSKENYILVDESKFVNELGSNFKIPIEIFPESLHLVETELAKLGATEIDMRMAQAKDGPVITEWGNLLLDTKFLSINEHLEKEIKSIPGVIESGLFIGYELHVLK